MKQLITKVLFVLLLVSVSMAVNIRKSNSFSKSMLSSKKDIDYRDVLTEQATDDDDGVDDYDDNKIKPTEIKEAEAQKVRKDEGGNGSDPKEKKETQQERK